MRSVALGLWVQTGSRDETPAQAGVSHFLEHLLFKGTERHSAIEISELFDGMGAATNAATGKETTHLHARFLDEHTERGVRPDGRDAAGAGAAPGRDRLRARGRAGGDRDVRGRAPGPRPRRARRGDLRRPSARAPGARLRRGDRRRSRSRTSPRYHDDRYTAGNIVVSAAGHVEHARIVELAERLLRAPAGERNGANGDGPTEQARLSFYPKETEQYHICFGGPGIARSDDRRFALAVLDTIFGGSVSSRLFREVREKRGLAYSVGSYTHEFEDRGFVAMYVGTRADNVSEACEIIGRELVSLRDEGVGADELARAKEHVKGRMVLGLEATGARMSRLARSDPVRHPAALARRDARRGSTPSTPTRSPSSPPSSTTRPASRRPASGRTRSCFRKRRRARSCGSALVA